MNAIMLLLPSLYIEWASAEDFHASVTFIPGHKEKSIGCKKVFLLVLPVRNSRSAARAAFGRSNSEKISPTIMGTSA